MRLLIIEDDPRIRGLTCARLREHGFTSDSATSLAEAEDALAVADYAALVLDIGLPDGDGLAWLGKRRAELDLPPVIILTARSSLGDRVTGLDQGADDYMVKPFAVDELAARLRALLRRPGSRIPTTLQSGALCFCLATRSVNAGGTPIEITRLEGSLLELLMRSAGCVVNRATIENALYGFNEPVTPNAVEALMSRLRRKLEDAGVGDLLVTVRGVGYLLKDVPA